MHARTGHLRVWSLLMLLPNTATAQAPAEPTTALSQRISAAETLVVTATRRERPLSNAPGSVQAITPRDIADIGAQTLDDVLQTAVGLAPTGNPGRVDSASVRGTGTGRTLFLIDGRRLANGFRDTIDLGRVLLPAVERIELYRGPSSALYGSDAIGGIINLITRKPQRTGLEIEGRYDLGKANGYQGNIVGTYSDTRFTALATAGIVGQKAFDDNTVAGLTEVDDTSIAAGLVQGEYRLNNRHRVSFGGSLTGFDREGNRQIRRVSRARDSDDLRAEAFLRYDGGSGDELSWFAQANYSRFETDITFNPTLDGVDTGVSEELAQLEGQLDWKLGSLSVLSVGGDVRRDNINEPDSRINEGITNSGGFIQLDLWLNDSLNFLAGLRGDYHSEFGGNLAPRTALVWAPRENLRLRASYGQGFKAPTLSQLNVTQLRRRGREVIENNPALEPETSHGFDVGVEAELGLLQASLTGFYNLIDDRIDSVLIRTEPAPRGGGRSTGGGAGQGGGSGSGGGTGGGGGAGGISIFNRENVTEVTSRGIELAAAIALPSGWFAQGNATLIDIDADPDGAPRPEEPEWRSFAKIGWHSTSEHIRAVITSRFTGQIKTNAGADIASTAIFGTYGEYRFRDSFTFFAGIENLTDERDADNFFVPRQFFAGLRYRL